MRFVIYKDLKQNVNTKFIRFSQIQVTDMRF